MTLNAAERERTSAELRDNLERSGSTTEQIQNDLSFSAKRFENTIDVTRGSNPVDVWLLRDHLEQLIRANGSIPAPYSTLTEGARATANGWFTLHRPPSI